MTDYPRGSQEETDAQLLHDAKAFGGTIGRDLLELIERLDNKSTAMQALLERWVEIIPSEADSGGKDWWCPTCEMWIAYATFQECCTECGRPLTNCQPSDKTFQLHEDTKTLLKEAKDG